MPFIHKGKGFNTQPAQQTSGQTSYGASDYAQNLDEDTARKMLSDNRFLQDIYDYYGQRDGKTFESSDDAVDYYLNDRRWRNLNTVSIGRDVYDAHSQSDAQSTRLARIQQVYDALPFGVDGAGNAILEGGAAMLADPINLIGFGAGGQAARLAVGTAAKGMSRKQLVQKGLGAGTIAGARGEAIASGIAEGVADIGIQNRNVALGLQDEVSYMRAAGAAGIGAATGGAMGAGMGLAGAAMPTGAIKGVAQKIPVVGRAFDDTSNAAAAKGITQLSDEGLAEVSRRTGKDMDRSSITRGMADRAANAAGRVGSDGNIATPTPSVRGDVGQETDYGDTLDQIAKATEEEKKMRIQEAEQLRAEGDEAGANRLLKLIEENLDPKLSNIRNIRSWPTLRDQTIAKINAEQQRMAQAGETQSQVLDDLNAYYEKGNTQYEKFKAQADIEAQNGTSQLADRIDSYFDEPANRMADEGVQLPDGSPVTNRVSEQDDLLNLNPPAGDKVTPQPISRSTPEPEQAASDAVEQVVDTAEAAAADEAVPLEQRIQEITNRLDGRRKGSIGYERKRLDREMANLPEKLEDGTDNPEYLTLKNRRDAIEKEELDLKEEQRTLEEQFAEDQADAVEDLATTNKVEVTEAPASETSKTSETSETSTTKNPEPALDPEVHLNEVIENDFVPTVKNIRKEFASLGLRGERAEAIIKDMPKGNSKSAVESRRQTFREAVNMVRGEREWQRMLNLSNAGQGIPDSYYDETIVSALIETSVPEILQPHAVQAFRDWRGRQARRIGINIMQEQPYATFEEMGEIAAQRFGDSEITTSVVDFFTRASRGEQFQPVDSETAQFIAKQIRSMPEDMKRSWNAFKTSALTSLTKKLGKERAEQMIRENIELYYDNFIRAEAYQAKDANGKVYSTRKMATRTTSPMDLNEDAIKEGHGEHIGRIQQNLQNITTGNGKPGSGKDISPRQMGRIQSILRQIDPHSGNDYFGNTMTRVRTKKDGKLFIYDEAESARRLNQDAMVDRTRSQAGAFDPVLRERSIEAAQAARDNGDTNVRDPLELEAVMKEIELAQGALARANKKLDNAADMADAKLNEAVDKASDRLSAANQAARRFVGDAEEIMPALKELYNPLVRSDKGTVVANKVEKERSSAISKYYDVQARLRGVAQELRTATRKGEAEKVVELKKERAKLLKKTNEMLDAMSPTDRKRLKADDATAAIRTLGNLKREARRSSQGDDLGSSEEVPMDELKEEIEATFNHNFSQEDELAAEYYANQEELASIAYQEQAGKLDYLQDNAGDMSPEELKTSAIEIAEETQQKINAKKPDTRPKGEPNPNLVQIGDRVYNMAKDVQYQATGDKRFTVFVDGKQIGSIREMADGTFQIVRKNGDRIVSVTAENRPQALQKLAKAAKRELDAYLDGKGVSKEPVPATTPVTIPDYHHTTRYEGVEDVPATTAPEDPMASATDQKPQADVITQEQMNEGKTLALQIIDPKHRDYGTAKGTRVLNINPVRGNNVQTNSSQITGGLRPDQYVIGDVDTFSPQGDNTRSGTVHARKTFRPLNPDDEFVSFGGERMTGAAAGRSEPVIPNEVATLPDSPNARHNRATHINELDNIPVLRDNEMFDDQSGALGELMVLMPEPIRTGQLNTIGKLARFAADMEDTPWQSFSSLEDFDFFSNTLSVVYRVIAEAAPNGIKLPNQTRQKSYKQLRQMIAGKNEKEIGEILSVFNMISGSANRQSTDQMPIFDRAVGETFSYKHPGSQADDQMNQIVLGGGSANSSDTLNFAHEMGHWAYQNILTPEDRMEFWQIARGYVGSDGADIAKLKAKMPGLSSSEVSRPSEFFANQFSMYVANRRKGATGSLLERLFSKVGRSVEGLVRKMLGMGDSLDTDMVKLFDRIMPDPEIADGSVSAGRPIKNQFDTLLAKANSADASRGVTLSAQQLYDLREMQIELEEALRVGGAVGHDPAILADILEKVSRRVYGKFGGKPGTRTHRSRRDASGNVIEGGKRITALDSYDGQGRPVYSNKPEIVLPNGKKSKPFMYMGARIARGRMLSSSFKSMRFLQDERLTNALSRVSKSEIEEAQRLAEIQALIDTQETGDILSMPDEAMAYMSPAEFGATSGDLESMFERDAGIIAQMMNNKNVDDKVTDYLVQQANDMIVALDGGIDEFVGMFNRNFGKTGTIAPAIDKAGRVYKSGNKISQRFVKATHKKNEKLARALLESITEAEAEVFGSAPDAVVNPKITGSPKEKSTSELLAQINNLGRNNVSAEVKELKQEVFTRMQAGPYTKPYNELNQTERTLLRNIKSVDDARAMYEEGMEAGDYDKAQVAISYLANKTEAPLPVKTSLVNRAIDIETKQRSTPDSNNGIPGDAPAAIKEALTKVTHRNKRVEYASRTILYRTLNLMGRTATDLVENNTTFMTVEDLFKLSGNQAPREVKAAFTETAQLQGPQFNDLRKQLRTYAIGITEGNADPIDMMHEIGHMIARATFDDMDRDHMLQAFQEAYDVQDPLAMDIADLYHKFDGSYTEKDVAEEWFVENWGRWMTERATKGSIFDVKDADGFAEVSVKGYLAQLADRLYEYTAYVLNGLIGRKSVKQLYRQMTYHGDMFTRKRKEKPITTAVNTYQYPAVAPQLAKNYADEVVKNMSREKQLLVREFLGIGPDDNIADYVEFHGTPVMDEFNRTRNPDAYLRPSEDGMFGEGVYTTVNSDYASGYADGNRINAYERLVDKMEDGERKTAARDIVRQMNELNTQLEQWEWESVHAEIVKGIPRQEHAADKLADLMARFESAKEAFARATNNPKGAGVVPVFVRTKNHFNFGPNAKFTFGDGTKTDVSHLLATAQKRGYISEDGFNFLAREVEERGELTGKEFYEFLTMEMEDPSSQKRSFGSFEERRMGRKKLSQFLRDEGYEGIISFVEDFNSGSGKLDETVTFDPNHIKHVDADFFDSDRRGMYYSVLGRDGQTAMGADMLEAMSLTGKAPDIMDMANASRKLQEAGVPDLAPFVRRVLRKEAPTAEDVDAVRKNSSIFSYFRENSQRLREMGASWLGDYIKPQNGVGLYERHDIDLSDKVFPIYEALKQLPDNKGWAKRWARRSAAFLPNNFTSKADLEASPKSHQRILGAIRRGELAVRDLNVQEQRVARQIIAAFEAERERMVSSGLPVGDTRRGSGDFYVPQQWDVELMRQSPAKAKKAFAQFFWNESRRPDFEYPPLSDADAARKADDIINAMIDADGETYGDDVIRRAVGDPFHSRIINLEPDEYDFMEEFLVNDLDGLIAQYFDRTTRKIALTDKFGASGHGFSAYVTTGERGIQGAVNTLRSNKKVVYMHRQYQEEAPIEHLIVPALQGSDKDVTELVTEASNIIKDTGNKDAAKNLILSRFPSDDQADPNLRVRVDAIVNAMADFPDGTMTPQAKSLGEDMMDIMNKRPLKKYSQNVGAYKISRTVKAFNSITLLAFTTLTSLGDVALPLVRSGNLKAWYKANKQWMGDPSYRNASKQIGVGIENLMHDRMVQMAGEGSQKLQNSFFNFTLLTPWTNMQREVAGIVGFEAFKSELARARRMKANGQEGSKAYKTAERFLRRYGMTGPEAQVDFLAEGAPMLTDIRASEMLENKALRYALLRFTNEAIYTPNPNDIPTWAQTPWGSMFFQLKSFQLMMARMSKYVYDEARHGGNYAPALYLATVGAGFGYGSAAIKDVVQSRGGEDNESRELRERKLTSTPLGAIPEAMFGLEEGSDTDKILGNYLEGMMAIGGLGLFAELLYNTAEQADNSAYGKMRIAGAIFGPAVGTFEDAVDVFVAGPAGIFDEKAARRREAVRSIVGRVPVAGGIRGFKEGVVDAVAGEAGSGGKKKQATKFGKSKGFGSGGFGKEGF